MRTRQEAVKAALASEHNEPGMCQAWTHEMFGLEYGVGDVDKNGRSNAKDGWEAEPGSARHTGDRHPPAGVKVYYSGGSHGDGHAAVSLGDGKIRTTDGAGSGNVATRDLDWPEKTWGLTYVGWSETVDGQDVPAEQEPDPDPPVSNDPNPYDDWSQEQKDAEIERLHRRLANLTSRRKKARVRRFDALVAELTPKIHNVRSKLAQLGDETINHHDRDAAAPEDSTPES